MRFKKIAEKEKNVAIYYGVDASIEVGYIYVLHKCELNWHVLRCVYHYSIANNKDGW